MRIEDIAKISIANGLVCFCDPIFPCWCPFIVSDGPCFCIVAFLFSIHTTLSEPTAGCRAATRRARARCSLSLRRSHSSRRRRRRRMRTPHTPTSRPCSHARYGCSGSLPSSVPYGHIGLVDTFSRVSECVQSESPLSASSFSRHVFQEISSNVGRCVPCSPRARFSASKTARIESVAVAAAATMGQALSTFPRATCRSCRRPLLARIRLAWPVTPGSITRRERSSLRLGACFGTRRLPTLMGMTRQR